MTVIKGKTGRGSVSHTLAWSSGGRFGSVAEADTFATWRGRPMGKVLDFASYGTWANIASCSNIVGAWGGTAYASKLVMSMGMLPTSTVGSPTIALGAAGNYDTYFTQAATALNNAGLGSITIRLGWEFNGNWYPWSAGGKEADWITYWRRIVTAMKAVSANFRFDWCVNNQSAPSDATLAWPGTAYVDDISVDAYDISYVTGHEDNAVRWNTGIMSATNGLPYWRAYATTQGKPFAVAEWAVWDRVTDTYGSKDDPHYIQRMYEWFTANNIAWESYFVNDAADGLHSLLPGSTFPQSALAYRGLFGNGP